MNNDLEIARACKMRPIYDIAKGAGIDEKYIEPYGLYKAKVALELLDAAKGRPDGKLILVSAITPTPAGEGKTTTTVGLADGLRKIGKKSIVALREPSLGPVFGMKGGACGGGMAQVVPMEDINLHFTGDLHAIGTANNLLAAMLDNHIHRGNSLGIDTRNITWRRCMDMNDRQLRYITSGLGGKANGFPREDGFDITAASEVMAAFCMASGMEDLKARLGRIIVAYNMEGAPVTAGQLRADGAMAVLLKEALNPNLVQTLEGCPAIIHGGPFANIAHGCNTVVATKMALKLGGYCVTEAGFGADLGAEKFLDIKCKVAGLEPSAVIIVATVRALKHHGGAKKESLNTKDTEALQRGIPNLMRHVNNIKEVYGLPCAVAINEFVTDTDEEIRIIEEKCAEVGVRAIRAGMWEKGGAGGIELAREAVRLADTPHGTFKPCYTDEMSVTEKINAICTKIYHADGVDYEKRALAQLRNIERNGYGKLPICMAKTQYSFTDDPTRTGAAENFRITVRNLKVSAGAGFIVALTGDIMTMPGLPKVPAAESIDIDDAGNITGLF